jgi:hypothetical protein
VCVRVVCVCVLFVHLFQDDLRCLFRPHQVNHGGVQKPLRRHRSGRSCQVLSNHSGQVGKLLWILFPPHQGVRPLMFFSPYSSRHVSQSKELKKTYQFVCDLQIYCHFSTQNSETDLTTNKERYPKTSYLYLSFYIDS